METPFDKGYADGGRQKERILEQRRLGPDAYSNKLQASTFSPSGAYTKKERDEYIDGFNAGARIEYPRSPGDNLLSEWIPKIVGLIGLGVLASYYFGPSIMTFVIVIGAAVFVFAKFFNSSESSESKERPYKSQAEHYEDIEKYKKIHEKNGFKLLDEHGKEISPLKLDLDKKNKK